MFAGEKIVTITYSRQGGRTSLLLLEKLRQEGFSCDGYLFDKYRQEGLSPFRQAEEIIGQCFREGSGLVFVCAVGIAVRQISGFIQSKQTDSPVLVMDETGKFVIPVLSGHLGGANELARICANGMGALPVITTATDLHGRFAVDLFAAKNNLLLDDMKMAKEISARILESETIPVYLEECFAGTEPDSRELELIRDRSYLCREEWDAGIIISPYRQKEGNNVLHLVPRQVILGVGCRKGVRAEEIGRAVFSVMEEYGIDWRAVCRLCTIDRKKGEPGLTEFCARQGIPMKTFGQEELALLEGEFSGSAFVREITGVDNVCERSAMAGGGQRLIVRKQKRDGVTVAAAVFQVGLDFTSCTEGVPGRCGDAGRSEGK